MVTAIDEVVRRSLCTCNNTNDRQQPGRRDLLLKALLGTHAGGAAHAAGERRAAQLEQRERARLDAVAAYRALKKSRRLQERAAPPGRR